MSEIKTRMSAQIGTMIDYHDFGVKDNKGREVGTKIITYMVEFVEEKDDARAFYNVPPGTYFGLKVQACRGNIEFGASQRSKRFNTQAERDAAVSKYLRDAKKRALKDWGK